MLFHKLKKKKGGEEEEGETDNHVLFTKHDLWNGLAAIAVRYGFVNSLKEIMLRAKGVDFMKRFLVILSIQYAQYDCFVHLVQISGYFYNATEIDIIEDVFRLSKLGDFRFIKYFLEHSPFFTLQPRRLLYLALHDKGFSECAAKIKI